MNTLIKPKNNHIKKWMTTTFLLMGTLLISSSIYSQSANLDQIRNGKLGVYSPTPLADWVNGNAGPQNAHFAEGYSIPYRASVSGLVGNASTVHTLIIEWDTKHGNGHALDYITHYANLDNPLGSHNATFGHGPETIDPTMGTTFAGAPLLTQIPSPSSAGSEVPGQPTTSFNNLPGAGYTNNPNITKFASWGATEVVLSYVFEDEQDATTAQTTTRLKIEFKSIDGQTALFAWGGHIAAEYDWGPGRGATGVSGSPYHTRIIEIDGKPGNQDRSLKATAVIIPPPLCGIGPAQLACPETPFLTFDATGSSTGSNISYVWSINNSNTAGAQLDPTTVNSYTVKVIPTGSAFIAGGTFNLSLTVNKTGAESTTCNRSPAGTIQNVIATASANPTTIDITSAAHSTTLTADIGAGSTDPNNANYDYQWSIVTAGTTGVLSNATSRIATYTAGIGDAGSQIEFKVIATQKAAPNCSDDATVTVNVSSVGACDVTPQGPVCQGATTTHNGSPNPKPTTATYTWVLSGYGGAGTTTSTLASANGGVSMQVNATQSYRITLNQVYENTAANTSCYEDVQVIPTPTIATTYNAPACDANTFSVTVGSVANPVIAGASYSITDKNGAAIAGVSPASPYVAPNANNFNFTNIPAGSGYIVTVTTAIASCTASSNCGSPDPSIVRKEDTKLTEDAVNKKEEAIADKGLETVDIELKSGTQVKAMPNPFTDRIRFNLVSGVSGMGSLELYNVMGQKVGVVYQGYIQAGRAFNQEFNVPEMNRNTLIYVFKVGDQQVTGKLIGLKQ